MKFLTRITVDHRTAAQQRLNDSYAWHQALWNAFPEKQSRDFLYRIEEREAGFLAYLLSETRPVAPGWGRWETKDVGDSFLEHTAYRFQLCANPTRRYVNDGQGNRFEKSKRFVVADPDALKQWLLRKAEQGGFAVDEAALQIGPPVNQPFYKGGRKGNHRRVEFSGLLTVTDREQFKETFKKGIGSAKAFGFGLLVLQPIQ
jgi:CRISPR system Cascade subunit CasE